MTRTIFIFIFKGACFGIQVAPIQSSNDSNFTSLPSIKYTKLSSSIYIFKISTRYLST
jgi:hypothetical protein